MVVGSLGMPRVCILAALLEVYESSGLVSLLCTGEISEISKAFENTLLPTHKAMLGYACSGLPSQKAMGIPCAKRQ